MKYALNLEPETKRILSATYPRYATPDMPIVDKLPEGDISEYVYKNGRYYHSPLEK